MQAFMLGLDRIVRRHRWGVAGAWLVLLVLAVPLSMRQSDHLTGGGFVVPGSQSDAVALAQAQRFAAAGQSTLGIALVPVKPGPRSTPALLAALDRAEQAIRRTAHATLAPGADRLARAAAARGGIVLVPIDLTVSLDRSIDLAADLRRGLDVDGGPRAGVATHVIGQGALWAGLQDLSKRQLKTAETTGLPIVLLILLIVFGSLAAALLPLALGVASVTVTGAAIYLLSQTMEMSIFVTNMASMIGIGVAVDYSLFVLARYREEVAAGAGREAARATALATSGVAVACSGLTVIVSLGGLWMIDNDAIRSMALGAIMVVAVSVIGSATLLPALISLLGDRVAGYGPAFDRIRLAVRRRRRAGTVATPARPGFWVRWTSAVTRRPALTAATVASVLLVLAIPALSLHMGTGALRELPAGNETQAGFDAAARITGPGATSPVEVLVSYRGGDARARAAVLTDVRDRVASDPGILRIDSVARSRDRRAALILAVPRADGESTAAVATMTRLRAELPGIAGSRAGVAVGGVSAAEGDLVNLVSGSMWKILLFVLGLSYIVLFVLLRSAVLPLKAVAMNLLSVGAAYGALVAVFQWGWFDGVLGVYSRGPLDVLTPPLVLAVVFGLSMDYEVFLLTRIRERWQDTGDTHRAVAEGLARSARTITSAALIMVAVFAVFVASGMPTIQQLGLGCAVAIGIDATLVRLVLVPATMDLLGRWNWWLPAWAAAMPGLRPRRARRVGAERPVVS
jgi:RND superfamily putative drug exporter